MNSTANRRSNSAPIRPGGRLAWFRSVGLCLGLASMLSACGGDGPGDADIGSASGSAASPAAQTLCATAAQPGGGGTCQ